MNIIFGIVLAYLILPVIGEVFVYFTGLNLYAGSVDLRLITYNIIHVVIILFFAYKSTNNTNLEINILPYRPNRIILRCSIIAFFGLVIVFSISGYKFFILGSNTGDIRVSLGSVGIIYTWLIRFLLPAILALSTLTFIQKSAHIPKTSKSIYYLTWILVVFSGISTGYKSTVITMILPALCLLFFRNQVLGLALKVTPVVLMVLTITTAIARHSSLSESFLFLMHRMTVMVAYGTIGVWNNFPNGAGFSESIKLSYSIFGNNIAEVLLGYSQNSIEFLSINLSRLITYLAYPNADGALSGSVNVTVTNFGEAFYMLGNWFPIYSLLSGVIFSICILKFKSYLSINKTSNAIVMLTFICAVILPWLNSSSIFILVSLPTIIWILMTYLVVYLIQYAKLLR